MLGMQVTIQSFGIESYLHILNMHTILEHNTKQIIRTYEHLLTTACTSIFLHSPSVFLAQLHALHHVVQRTRPNVGK